MPATFSRQIDHRCAIEARLDEDGNFTVTCRGQSSWREGAQASGEVPVDAKHADAIHAAMEKALDAQHEAVAHAADAAAMRHAQQEAERGMTFEELGERLKEQGTRLDVSR